MFWILKQNNSLKTKQQTKEGWQVVSCLANQREKLWCLGTFSGMLVEK